MTTLERRHSERARIPCNIPVELTDASHSAQFEADATDLSVGGLSLRAGRLPDLGSQLFCCFEAMPGGATVLGRGEVVWREPSKGAEGGEFGLRFIEIDPKNQALIDEMVAERIARIESPFGHQPAALAPVFAKLEIENVADAVSARLVHTGETEALFEQSLDQFSVGKAVIAHAGVSLVRGHIASVKLRMEGASPRLILTLELPRDPSRFGEYEWGEPGSDTDPDIFDYKNKPEPAGEPLLEDSYSYETNAEADDDADAELSGEDDDDDEDDESSIDDGAGGDDYESEDSEEHVLQLSDVEIQDDDVLPNFRRERSRTLAGMGQAAQAVAPIFARNQIDAGTAQLPLFKGAQTLVEGQRLQLSLEGYQATNADIAEHERQKEEAIMALLSNAPTAEAEGLAGPLGDAGDRDSGPLPVYEDAANSPFVRVLRVLARMVDLFRSVTERSRELVEKLRQQAPQGLGKGMFTSRRRVTAHTAQPMAAAPKRKRLLLIGVGAFSVIGLAVVGYTLSGLSGGEDSAEQAEAGDTVTERNTALAAPDAREPGPVTGAGDAPNPSPTAAKAASSSSAPNAPNANASDARVVKANGPAKEFGQRQIRNPRRFLLRMSEPVKLLQGTADAGGFSVVIANNHATERAVAIRSGHPAVASAQIINRRDRSAELRVRFVAGHSPAFRVTGHGSALEVLIEQ
jgi:hypothetical protein